MEAIILAGGLGTRLRAVIADLPKPMAPIKGRPFLEYQMDFWIAQGVDRFILSVGYKKETIRAHFGNRYGDSEVAYAEEDRQLGTGGALLHAARILECAGDFLLLNGDTYYDVSLTGLRQAHVTADADMTLALRELDVNDRYSGVRLGPQSEVMEFQRRDEPVRERLVNGGVYLINPRVLKYLTLPADRALSLEDEILPSLLEQGRRVLGHVVAGQFLDIGLPEDYRRASSLFS